MRIQQLLLIGSLAVVGSTFANAQASRFHTTRPIEFRLAEGEPAPGLVPVHVNGEARIIYVHPEVQLDDRDIRAASVVRDATGQPAVQVHLRPSGVQKFNALVKANRLKMLAIASRDKVISAPIVEGTPMIDDLLDITGVFTGAEASALAKALSK
jgi:preprotein translocase subunit SecD